MKNQILWQPYPGGRMMVYFCWDLCLQVFWKYHMTEAMCSQLEWVRFVAQKNMSKIYETQSWIVDLLSRTRFRKQLTPLPNYCVHTHKLSLSLSRSPPPLPLHETLNMVRVTSGRQEMQEMVEYDLTSGHFHPERFSVSVCVCVCSRMIVATVG